MLAAFLAFLVPALCATLKGSINGLQPIDFLATSLVLRDLATSHRERQLITTNGTFEFYELDPRNRYLLSLDSDTLELPFSYLVVPKEDGAGFDIRKVSEGRPLDSLGPSVSHPISIVGAKRASLVVDQASFSVIKFFTQPTVLLSLGSLVLVTYLPSWIASMDPELLEEMQKNQLNPGAASEKLQGVDLAKSIAERRAK